MEFDDHDDQEEEEEEGEEEEEEEEEDIMEDISIPITMAPVHLSQIVDPDGGITSNSRKNGGAAVIRYRECQKNHAAGIGRHAVDGCCEFIAAGEEDTLDALKCAACNCHRNFHRKETAATTVSDQHQSINNYQLYHGHHQFSSFPNYYRSYPHPSGYLNNLNTSQPRPLALPGVTSGGGGGCQSRDEGEDASIPSSSNGGGGGSGSKSKSKRKKRYRTKFTAVQKEKMLELSERIGWRIQKHDESAVEQFSLDTGVSRHVLKVWMHNNKHTLCRKP